MSIEFLPKSAQPDGQFNGGAILEKRPIVMSRDALGFRPYSNIFYWAHAWSESGSTIGEHPHQGFEILSFVLKGAIEHFDSSNKKWIKLKEGDVQIIRSGNGISHSEKLLPGSAMFQIWFDPDLQKSISKIATYNDYPASGFPEVKNDKYKIRILKGEGSPLQMDSVGVEIAEYVFEDGIHNITLDESKIYAIFIVRGIITIDDNSCFVEDFIRIGDEKLLNITTSENTKLFIVSNPKIPGYRTYEMMQKG